MHASKIAPLSALLLGAIAQGQVATNGLNIVVGDNELAAGESTTIRLEAYFGGTDYAVAGLATWLQSSEGEVGLSAATLIAPMNGPGTSAGLPGETGIRGIIAGQLNFPGGAGIFADPSNPIAFWEVTYTAPAAVAAPFDVALETRTSKFDVYVAMDLATSASRLTDFADGMATVHVIPAPAGAMVLVGLVFASNRRRVAP